MKKSAFPIYVTGGPESGYHPGMTIREYYAGEAMKVMAQEVPLENYSPASVKKIFKTRAVLSVMYADALIAELSEERGNS